MKQNTKKPAVAFFTSAAHGLAHYVAHLYPEVEELVDPYYVTYADREVDDLVKEKVKKVYKLIQPESAVSILGVIQFLKNNKINVINLQVSDTVKKLYLEYSSMLAYAKYLKIPICLTIHDVYTVEKDIADPAGVELIYSLGDSFIVGNETEKDRLELYFNKKPSQIFIATHGPYSLFDKGNWTGKSAKKELKLENKKVILFFGQIRANKGLKYLIKAFPQILKSHKDAHLYISTDLHMSTPELNEYLNRVKRSGVASNITLIKDYIPSSEIEKVFKAADVVVLPYTTISQSGILNLAFAFRKPVVVSDVFFESSTINGKMGYSFPSQNSQALADVVNKIFSMPDLGRSMGEAGHKYSTTKANWKLAAKKTFGAFKAAIKDVHGHE
jgi:glycosyltransferase involved in cell wall biosynthesis